VTTGPEGQTAVIDAVFLTNTSRDQALECIAHLREPEIASVVVVDNASSDDTVAAIRGACPDVTVIALTAGTGIAAALNRGAELGTAPFVLYLNDDVFALPGSVRLLLEALRQCDDAVAAGGRLVEQDLATQDRYRPRAFPTPATVVARLLGLDRLWPRNPMTGVHLRQMLDDRTTVEVDQPAGACMLVRRAIVERIGGWDERYWFWYEDVDLSRRLAAHGTQLYVPTAPFRHIGGATVGRMSRAEGHRCVFHGMLLYAETHFSRAGLALVAVTLAAIGLARAATAIPSDRSAAATYVATVREALTALNGRRG
jgi:GT2 family glycosyltransferase